MGQGSNDIHIQNQFHNLQQFYCGGSLFEFLYLHVMFDVTKHSYICMDANRVNCSPSDYVLPTVVPLKSTPAVGKGTVEVINNNYIID